MAFEVREEVLNVTLAQLLSERGFVGVPETIQKAVIGKGKKLPDITIVDYWGLRVVVECRLETSGTVRKTLAHDAQKRVVDGISHIALAVLYPKEVKTIETLAGLKKALKSTRFQVRVFSDSEEGSWSEASLDELADILRGSYEMVITDEVVTHSVNDLSNAIEHVTTAVIATPGTPQHLADLLGIPPEEDGEGK